jgi:hypothetical protein
LGSIIGMAGWLAIKSSDCTASVPGFIHSRS